MSHGLPGVFFHETADGLLASKEEGFTKCKSYDQWMGSTLNKPYKQILHERLRNFVSSIWGATQLEPGVGQLLATTMLDKLSTQFHELASFIQAFYSELTDVSKFDKDRAWVLVGRCVGAIFEDQRKYPA